MHSKTVEFFLDSTIEIRLNVPMAHYSSVKIGGEAAIVAFPQNEADLINSIRFLHDNSIKYRLVGRMTNILPKDEAIAQIRYCRNPAVQQSVHRRSAMPDRQFAWSIHRKSQETVWIP